MTTPGLGLVYGLHDFRNLHLSVSRLKLYEQCPRAFWFRYVDPEKGKQPKAPLPEAPAFGIVLHEALERLFGRLLAEEFAGLIPVDYLLDEYRKAWAESKLNGIELYQEGLNILRTYVRDHPKIDHLDIIAFEQEFNLLVTPTSSKLLTLQEKDALAPSLANTPDSFIINGFIDRIDRRSPTAIEIIDYKSNRMLFHSEEVSNDLQMSVYGLVARELYPWATNIHFVFHMLRHAQNQATERTTEQLDDARSYVIALGHRTETDGVFAPTLNSNCGYCDSRDRCPKYVEAMNSANTSEKVSEHNLEALATERNRVAQLARFAYARQKELDTVIKRQLNDVESLHLANTTFRLVPTSETEHSPRDIVDILTANGVDPFPALRVHNETLKNLLRTVDNPMLAVRIAAKAVTTSGTPKIQATPDKKAKVTPK
jgi:putative RecB family exonuclease